MYGHCRNCWWYDGAICVFQKTETEPTSYCPDYVNREKENKKIGTLEEYKNKTNSL